MSPISLATLPNFHVAVSRTPMVDSAHFHQGFVSRFEPEDQIPPFPLPYSTIHHSPGLFRDCSRKRFNLAGNHLNREGEESFQKQFNYVTLISPRSPFYPNGL